MSSSLEDIVARKVASKVISDIDVEKLAAKLAPQVLKTVEARLLSEIKDMDLSDLVYDCLPYKELERALRIHIIKGLKNK